MCGLWPRENQKTNRRLPKSWVKIVFPNKLFGGFIKSTLKPGSRIPPTYLRCRRRLQLATFGDLSQCQSRAHLRWIADVLKLVRNANWFGAIFNSFISNTVELVLLECQFSLALVIVMRPVRKKKSKKIRTRRKYWPWATKPRPVSDTLFADLRLHGQKYFVRYHEFSLYYLITETVADKKKCPQYQLYWQHLQDLLQAEI